MQSLPRAPPVWLRLHYIHLDLKSVVIITYLPCCGKLSCLLACVAAVGEAQRVSTALF